MKTFPTIQSLRRLFRHVPWAAVILSGIAGGGCQSPPKPAPADPLKAWHERRHKSVAGPDGWATLVGLHWLPEGRSTCGSAATNAHVFPAGRVPAFAGTWIRSGFEVRFEPADGVPASVAGGPVPRRALMSDAAGKPEVVSVGPLDVTVLRRGDRMALRVRDSEAATRVHFQGLQSFPYREDWKVSARLLPALAGTTLAIQNILGSIEEMPSAGTLIFNRDGKEHRLDAVADAEEGDLFVMFKDGTTGHETYPAGRFLHIPRPAPGDPVLIDFNRAYNPPCAFTPFATCPLPPAQNRLPGRVEAGELRYRGGH